MSIIDTVYPDGSPVNKAAVRSDDKSGHRRHVGSVNDVQTNDFSGQYAGLYVRTLQAGFDLDPTDTTSPHNGTTVLVDYGGNRFTLVPGSGNAREKLTANRTYYVAPSGGGGSDSNDGLSALTPFLTIQKAVDVASTLDLGGYSITVQLADGTYATGVILKNVVGFRSPGDLVIKGNAATPANVIISPTGADCFIADSIASVWDITDLRVQSTTSGNGLFARYGAKIRYGNLDFGACASSHIQAFGPGSVITCLSNYAITGGAQIHFQSYYGAQIVAAGRTVTITGTLSISLFADMRVLGSAQLFSMTFSGTYTVIGSRYRCMENAVCFVNGAGSTYFPGNASGTASTGGLYT